MGRRVATMLGLALVLALPAGAQAGVLHDQTAPAGTYSSNSEAYDPPSDPYNDQSADDFTVPPGESWTIQQVNLLGQDDPYLGMSALPIVNVFIYRDAGTFPDVPGSEVYRFFGLGVTGYPNDSAHFTDVPRPPPLAPGTYWISVQEDGGGFMVPSWYWQVRSVQDGNAAVFQNPSGAWGNGCASWKPLTTCFPGSDGPDLAWSISGSAVSQKVTFGKLKRLGDGTARLTVNIPGNGIVVLEGKDVRPQSFMGGKPKSVTMRIRAARRALRRLKTNGKVTVKAIFSFSAPGADPSKTVKRIKLTRN